MKFSHLLLFAAGVPLLACAQADRTIPAAADAKAPVTPLQYHSVFADYVVAKEAPQSPDKGWVRANRALLGEETPAPGADEQSADGTSRQVSKPEAMHGKHEHNGAHQ
jgi:hypothetical protein